MSAAPTTPAAQEIQATRASRPRPPEQVFRALNRADLTGLSVCKTIKYKDIGDTEGYFSKLDDFSVPAGLDARIHFDEASMAEQFRANPNAIHTTGEKAKLFTVEINKDAGGAEVAD